MLHLTLISSAQTKVTKTVSLLLEVLLKMVLIRPYATTCSIKPKFVWQAERQPQGIALKNMGLKNHACGL